MVEALCDEKKILSTLMLVRRMAHQEERDAQVEELVSQLGSHVTMIAEL